MRRIAVINQKGGVGKTTITANLGHALVLAGYKVTVIDLDPQGHLSTCLGIFRPPQKGMDEVLLNGMDIATVTMVTRESLSLVPAGGQLGEVEQLHDGGAARARLLVDGLKDQFIGQDFVLMDCPPSSGLLVTNAIFAADEVLIPTSGDYLSLTGLANLMSTLKKFEPYRKKPLDKWIELSRFVNRRRLANEVKEKLLKHFPNQVLATPISEAAVMAECPGVGRTIFEYRRTSRSAKEFAALADDLIHTRCM
ncbi:MAG: ParA family protein [Candidatus Polarisedimenticolaceae bacterium]|nr:ParA family protein [Candidatus Polarisedimenticolaceae bacterium]